MKLPVEGTLNPLESLNIVESVGRFPPPEGALLGLSGDFVESLDLLIRKRLFNFPYQLMTI